MNSTGQWSTDLQRLVENIKRSEEKEIPQLRLTILPKFNNSLIKDSTYVSFLEGKNPDQLHKVIIYRIIIPNGKFLFN